MHANTNTFLCLFQKHPLKMGQFNKQNPAQWLNNLAMAKTRGSMRGGPNMMGGPNQMGHMMGGPMGPNQMGPMGHGMGHMGPNMMGPNRYVLFCVKVLEE